MLSTSLFANVPFYVTDQEKNVIYGSPAFYDTIGRSEIDGQPCHALLFGQSKPCSFCPLHLSGEKTCIETGKAVNGKNYNIDFSEFLQGDIRYRLGVLNDVSEQTLILAEAIGQIQFYNNLFSLQRQILSRPPNGWDEFVMLLADYFGAQAALLIIYEGTARKLLAVRNGQLCALSATAPPAWLSNIKTGRLSALPDDAANLMQVSSEVGGIVCRRQDAQSDLCLLLTCPTNIKAKMDDDSILAMLDIIGMTMRNIALQNAAAWIHEHDALTGLFNRNKYTAYVDTLQNYKGSIGVLFFDVNDLKQCNDTKGHKAGDALLKKAAKSIDSICDEHCVGFRLGGDEFAVVIKGVTQQELEATVEKWRQTLAVLNQSHDDLPCVISVGAAYAEGNYRIGDVLEAADLRMYADKKRLKALK